MSRGPSRTPPLRKHLRRRIGSTGVRYLTFSTSRRAPLLANPAIRDHVAAALFAARDHCGFALLAWVIMPEHLHVTLVPLRKDWPVERILHRLKAPLAQKLIGRWRRLGVRGASLLARITDGTGRPRLWQPGGGFDRAVRDVNELVREVNYIHRNPVKRGLVEKETDWPWSSARDYAALRESAREQDARSLHEHPGRAAVRIDTIHIDRYDFPEQAMSLLWLDGEPCLKLG
ncbi:MAG: transposase [Phycisphaerales bacterium]|nr:transposase [Phycisphaerales bacterium]